MIVSPSSVFRGAWCAFPSHAWHCNGRQIVSLGVCERLADSTERERRPFARRSGADCGPCSRWSVVFSRCSGHAPGTPVRIVWFGRPRFRERQVADRPIRQVYLSRGMPGANHRSSSTRNPHCFPKSHMSLYCKAPVLSDLFEFGKGTLFRASRRHLGM